MRRNNASSKRSQRSCRSYQRLRLDVVAFVFPVLLLFVLPVSVSSLLSSFSRSSSTRFSRASSLLFGSSSSSLGMSQEEKAALIDVERIQSQQLPPKGQEHQQQPTARVSKRKRLYRSIKKRLLLSFPEATNTNTTTSSSSSDAVTVPNGDVATTTTTTKGAALTAAASSSSSLSASTSSSASQSLDYLHARAGVLRRTILQQQAELEQLERKIKYGRSFDEDEDDDDDQADPEQLRVKDSAAGTIKKRQTIKEEEQQTEEKKPNMTKQQPQKPKKRKNHIPLMESIARTTHWSLNTFAASSNVLWRKLGRVRTKTGVSNQQWNSVADYVATQSLTGARIVNNLVQQPDRLWHLVGDPYTPTLVPHVPAILARLDRLETHVEPILERVLNNRRHLASIEPYLDQVLDRFDDIEPHLPWILDNIDVLAPYTGLLLRHIDDLLLYADADDEYLEEMVVVSNATTNDTDAAVAAAEVIRKTRKDYALAEQLLPYLEYYVSRLDMVGPHLPLLRPHVHKLLQYNRIARISPYIDFLFAAGYGENLGASANMDVLLFWLGWTLRVPGLPKVFFAMPGSPRMVTFLANRLPKRFVRGYCPDVTCHVDGDYGGTWNRLSSRNDRQHQQSATTATTATAAVAEQQESGRRSTITTTTTKAMDVADDDKEEEDEEAREHLRSDLMSKLFLF